MGSILSYKRSNKPQGQPSMLKKLFTIDLGNSHPHVGYFLNNKLEEVFSWRQFTQRFPINDLGDTRLVMCQVGPTPDGFHDYLPLIQPLPMLKDKNILEMTVHYSETLGLDRLYSAHHVYQKIQAQTLPNRVAIIDAGTFMTLDLVDQQGFQGGYILPGLSVFLQCYGKGHQLPSLSELGLLQEQLPQTTEQAISEAARLYIKEVTLGFLEKTNPQLVIITGGSCGILLDHLKDREHLHEPHWIHHAMSSLANSHLPVNQQ
jgi:pantothenate kinase type III